MTKPTKPHYGYYSLYIFAFFAVIFIVVGVVLTLVIWWPIGILILGFGVYFAVSYVVSIRLFRITESLDPPPILELKGDEQVLDVGCGLGKLTVGIAKHVPRGKVVGIDIWSNAEIPGNCPERAYQNAEIEGVKDRIEFKKGNLSSLPFTASSFDVVTASSVINNLHKDEDKIKAFREIQRTLKPGGRFLMLEPLRNAYGLLTFTLLGIWMLLPKNRWTNLLQSSGFTNQKFVFYNNIGAFLAEKPSSS